MTEQSGGDPIGKLQVDILGNLAPLEKALGDAARMLEAFDNDHKAQISRLGKATKGGTAPASAVGIATPGVVTAENLKISATAKVSGKDVAKDIQKSLDATLFKINIDVANLRAQIQQAFDGIGFGGITGAATGGGAPTLRQVAAGGIPDDIRGLLRQADAKSKGKNSKLSNAIDDFYDLLADGVESIGQGAKLPLGGEVGKTAEKLFGIMDSFGDNLKNWDTAFSPANLQKMGLGKDTAALASGTGKILQQKLATAGQPLLEGIRAIRLTGGGPTAAPVSTLPSPVITAPRTAIPVETPRDELIKDALQSLRSAAFFATPVGQPGDVTDPGKSRRRLPSERIAGSAAIPTSGAALGVPADEVGRRGEEEARALAQLGGGNRANVRRFRGRGQRGGAFPVDLEPFLRALERGDYRSVIETDEGEMRNLESRGNTEGDLLESDATIRELKRRSGGRKLTLPNSGIQGQVRFIKPQDVVRNLLTQRIGGDNAGEIVDQFLSDPTVATQLAKAAEQGGKSKVVPGNRPSGNYAPGAGPAATARATLRVDALRNKLIPGVDERIASLTDELESLQGSGRTERTSKLEGMIARQAKRRQDLQSQLEETLPYADRRLSPADARVVAAQDRLASGENRERVAAGEGLTPRERLERQLNDPGFIGADQRRKIASGLLPDPSSLLQGLDTFIAGGGTYPSDDPTGTGAFRTGKNRSTRNPRMAALFNALKPHIDEAEGQAEGLTGDDKRMAKQLIADAVGTIFREVGFRDREAESALPSDSSLGRGRVPRRVTGGTRTGASTAGGAAEMTLDFERPSTSLDVERQGLGAKIDAEARKIAERKLAALQASRKASGISDLSDPKGIEDFLFSPPVRGRGGRTVPRGIRPDVLAEVESSTDVGKRAAQIRATQQFADKVVAGLAANFPDLHTQRAAAAAGPLNLPEDVNEAEAKREINEILQSRTAQSARRPSTRGTKDPTLSDVLRERWVGAGGIVAGGGGDGGGGTATGGGNGRLGGPGVVPVVITGPFPLQVSFSGGGGGNGRNGRNGGPPAPDEAAAAAAASGNQGGKLRFLNAPPFRIGAYGLTPAEPTGLGRQRQVALMAQQRRLARFNGQNADIRGEEQDVADTELSEVRGQLRRAQRRVPKRGFGASLTDLVTSFAGGNAFQGQLESLGRAEREANELTTLTGRRANLRGQIRVREREISGLPAGSPRALELAQGLIPLRQELKQLEPAIARSRRAFDTNVAAATKASTVLRSFAGAAVGGAVSAAAGSVTFGLGLAITAPLIQAVSEGLAQGLGPAIERAVGFGGTAARVNDDLAQGVIAANGRTEIALAQHAAQIGLAGATAQRFAPTLGGRAETIAGNQQLQAQVDELNAFINTQKDNAGFRGGDKNLSQSVGGFLNTGIGGTPGTGQLIFDNLNGLPDTQTQANLQSKLNEDTSLLAASPSQDTTNALYDEIGRIVNGFAETDIRLDYWNKQLAKGGEATAKFSNTIKLSDKERIQQETALRAVNQGGLADLVRKGSLQITDKGQAVTDPTRLNTLFAALTKSVKPDVSQLLAQEKDQVQAQEDLRLQKLNLQNNTFNQAETGIAFAQSGPLSPAKTGFVPADQKKFNAELSKTQAIYDQVNAEGAKDVQIAKDFVSNAFPNSDIGEQFAASLDKVAAIGKEISGIQIGVQTQQAAYAAAQYSAQLVVAKRSLSDARGLAGQITGESKNNLGVLERQQFLLQKQGQQLGFAQTQRQINFQTAIAGITAPGLTGEERAARIAQAKLEAKYAQEQLDIQKKLAALGNKGFQISASRNVTDLVRQIGLLERGRVVTLSTAAAEKRILGLSKLQDKENKKVAAFYQAALEKTNDVLSLSAQLAAATGNALIKVEKQVLQTFHDTLGGMINILNADIAQLGGGTGNDRLPGKHAAGIVGSTSGSTDITVGEAGTETVAILRNPRKVTGSFGGGGDVTVQIYLSGNTFSGETQYKKLIRDVQDAVEKGMGRRASQLGLSTPR